MVEPQTKKKKESHFVFLSCPNRSMPMNSLWLKPLKAADTEAVMHIAVISILLSTSLFLPL